MALGRSALSAGMKRLPTLRTSVPNRTLSVPAKTTFSLDTTASRCDKDPNRLRDAAAKARITQQPLRWLTHLNDGGQQIEGPCAGFTSMTRATPVTLEFKVDTDGNISPTCDHELVPDELAYIKSLLAKEDTPKSGKPKLVINEPNLADKINSADGHAVEVSAYVKYPNPAAKDASNCGFTSRPWTTPAPRPVQIIMGPNGLGINYSDEGGLDVSGVNVEIRALSLAL